MATILIIDDREDKREGLELSLIDLGHRCITAENGLLGLTLARSKSPDLILLDIDMPVMDGFECLSELKADPQLRDIPVIIISAHSSAFERVPECIEAGADDMLPMPFDPLILRARINSGLGKYAHQKKERRMTEQLAQLASDLKDERDRADELLHAILPKRFAAELKESGEIRPRRYDGVAILFADVVGFTRYCNVHKEDPDRVLRVLSTMIETFEQIADEGECRLEKIKTIGDAFMAAGGLVDENPDAAWHAVLCGQRMVDATRKMDMDGLTVRVGIHSGTVMGGKIGQKKYCFDIWGDAVNTASRIESHGIPGSVVVSRTIWDQVADRVTGKSLGITDLKGTEPIELFEIESVRYEASPVSATDDDCLGS